MNTLSSYNNATPNDLLNNFRDNLYGPLYLASVCERNGIHFTHLGTKSLSVLEALLRSSNNNLSIAVRDIREDAGIIFSKPFSAKRRTRSLLNDGEVHRYDAEVLLQKHVERCRRVGEGESGEGSAETCGGRNVAEKCWRIFRTNRFVKSSSELIDPLSLMECSVHCLFLRYSRQKIHHI